MCAELLLMTRVQQQLLKEHSCRYARFGPHWFSVFAQHVHTDYMRGRNVLEGRRWTRSAMRSKEMVNSSLTSAQLERIETYLTVLDEELVRAVSNAALEEALRAMAPAQPLHGDRCAKHQNSPLRTDEPGSPMECSCCHVPWAPAEEGKSPLLAWLDYRLLMRSCRTTVGRVEPFPWALLRDRRTEQVAGRRARPSRPTRPLSAAEWLAR